MMMDVRAVEPNSGESLGLIMGVDGNRRFRGMMVLRPRSLLALMPLGEVAQRFEMVTFQSPKDFGY
jgi:hypothetical protein